MLITLQMNSINVDLSTEKAHNLLFSFYKITYICWMIFINLWIWLCPYKYLFLFWRGFSTFMPQLRASFFFRFERVCAKWKHDSQSFHQSDVIIYNWILCAPECRNMLIWWRASLIRLVYWHSYLIKMTNT